MKRRWKIALGVLGALVVLLAVNTVTTDSQTKEAEVTADGGQVLELSRGSVQITDTGEPAAGSGQPIVLLHCYACSLHWFDKIEPLLAEGHRVIRIDLLGFGGSEKPESGYEVVFQAQVVAEAYALGVEGALVAGNSLGAVVVASLAEQASQLVDRAVVIDMAPNTRTSGGPAVHRPARLSAGPRRGALEDHPNFAVRDAYKESFAPASTWRAASDPDQVLADYDAMTYTSFDTAPGEVEDFLDDETLDERFTRVPVPLMVIFAEDQIFDAEEAVERFAGVPGVRTELVEGAGHAPQVEEAGGGRGAARGVLGGRRAGRARPRRGARREA